MQNKRDKKSKFKRKAAAATAGVFAACSIAIASLTSDPSDLFGASASAETQQVAYSDERSLKVANPKPGAWERLRVRLRGVFFAQSSVVRGLILLPFWTVGKLLILLLSALFGALSPVWQAALGLLLNALLIFGLFAGGYKLFFPNKKLKDFLTKRNIVLLSTASLILAATDAVLRIYWDDYRPVSLAIKLAVGLFLLMLLSWRIYGKRKPRPVPATA
jgi:hypothetical protein